MTFYQSQWLENSENEFGKLRNTPEEAIKDLIKLGYGPRYLRTVSVFPAYDKDQNIGIAIIKV